MCEINHLHPDRMTPEQRRREVGALLAAGLVRLRVMHADKPEILRRESELVLGFSGQQSVHADTVNNEKQEPQ